MAADEQGPGSLDQGSGSPGRRGLLWSWIGEGTIATARGLALCGLSLAAAGVLLALAAPLALAGLGAGFVLNPPPWMPLALQVAPFAGMVISLLLLPPTLLAMRRLANQARRLSGAWCGVPIPERYRPLPGDGKLSRRAQLGWLLTDPATWRDVAWTTVNAGAGWLLAAPAALVAYGLIGLAAGRIVPQLALSPPGLLKNTPAALPPAGVALAALGLLAAPWLLRGYGQGNRLLLAPARQAEVARLAEARSQAVTAAEAERRRIERDLHDGLQPRLVALAVDLGIAEARFGKDPESARLLLARAHRDAKTAIEELRSLVRGIHPSVLDGRGLDAALSALVASCPVPVSLHVDLSQRPDPIREAAAYYVAAEAITNIAKHASARSAAVTVRADARGLRVVVHDDGNGGARPEPGGGLAGLAARIRSLDGTFTVSSPPGGPTRVEAVIPCER
ncbi:MAG: histidine kinase [Streptosporangiaceae bacterium]